MRYVNFEKQDGHLVITLTPEGEQEIQDSQEDTGFDDFFLKLLEHQLCNGWEVVKPEDIGALTSSIILSDDVLRDIHGNVTKVGRVYWFPNYQIESPVQTLLTRKQVTFTGVA